ncbi:phage integrase / plasmid pRiA4b ORF-3-like protein (plasmid) [Calothrix sp. NIES-4071]|nr:phage integrase / plasmid pRiA4b ORF-3-like protein [Calothrix sp. NIES-4071]BAZ64748.1 phage integrase / plasmid pRiA4b ORF-3-like protein [Calothrix sp. NIES-4105]
MKNIPDIVIVPLVQESTSQMVPTACTDLRIIRINEFLNAQELAPLTQKAYRHDFNYFLKWTSTGWGDVDADKITEFQKYLMIHKFGAKQKVLSDASVRRVLGTISNFFEWMYKSGYIALNPTTEVERPLLPSSETQKLSDESFKNILDAVASSNYPERNLALIAVLCHGLRPGTPINLDIKDYHSSQLHVRSGKHSSKEYVPLDDWAKQLLDNYLNWRQSSGEVLHGNSPLFLSHSNRNAGERISYDTVRKLVEKIRKKTGIHFRAQQFGALVVPL